MGTNIIPLSDEKVHTHDGIFDIKQTYKLVRKFLEDSRHYDVSEKKFESKNDGNKKKLSVFVESAQEYNDYYKIRINFELVLEGVEQEIQINGKSHKMVKGNAKLMVNSYIETDFMEKRPKSKVGNFLEKIYNNYIGKDEFNKVVVKVEKDVAQLIERFKQSMNETV